jgi:transposase
MRARIVLAAAADGGSTTELSERLGLAIGTLRRWCNRFAELRLDGLLDEPRPGRPRVLGDDKIEALIVATLETAPKHATHWSTRSMAEHLGLGQSMVSRVWRAFGLAPHKQDSWKPSKDPLFVAKVRDVVGLYLDPPEQARVLCVDEKTQIQALNRTQPMFPMLPGTPARASTPPPARHPQSSVGSQHIRGSSCTSPPYVWTKTAVQILASIGNYCTRINDSRH